LIARPKEKGGLGVKNLEKMNTSLLIKMVVETRKQRWFVEKSW
jgi:hypothetical protein